MFGDFEDLEDDGEGGAGGGGKGGDGEDSEEEEDSGSEGEGSGSGGSDNEGKLARKREKNRLSKAGHKERFDSEYDETKGGKNDEEAKGHGGDAEQGEESALAVLGRRDEAQEELNKSEFQGHDVKHVGYRPGKYVRLTLKVRGRGDEEKRRRRGDEEGKRGRGGERKRENERIKRRTTRAESRTHVVCLYF